MATGADLVAGARAKLGDPYIYGADGPDTFDCSGLTEFVYGGAGIKIPRTSSEQWAFLKKTGNTTQDKGALLATPGDLIFSQWPGDDATPGHVGIYIGGHQLIEAPKPGGKVHIATIDQNYFDHIYGVGHAPSVGIPEGTVADGLTPGSDFKLTMGSKGWTGPGISNGEVDAGGTGQGVWDFLAKSPMGQALSGNPHPVTGSDNGFLGISGFLDSIGSDIQWVGKAFYTLTLPTTWARIGAGFVGTILLIFGLYRLGKEVSNA